MKTILDLIKTTQWKDVRRALKYFYPHDKGDHSELYKDLPLLKGRREDKKEKIILKVATDLGQESSFYKINTNKYSLSLRKWGNLLRIPIEEETLSRYLPEDILAHFIWEITFEACLLESLAIESSFPFFGGGRKSDYGDEGDIAEIKQNLENSVKEMMSEPPNQ